MGEVSDVLPAGEEVVASDTKDSNDISNDQAKTTFPCLMCDFVSNWENGLQIHLTRKHANIEQIDGNTTIVRDQKYLWTSNYWKTGTVYQMKLLRKTTLMRKLRRMKKRQSWKQNSLLLGPNLAMYILGIGTCELYLLLRYRHFSRGFSCSAKYGAFHLLYVVQS